MGQAARLTGGAAPGAAILAVAATSLLVTLVCLPFLLFGPQTGDSFFYNLGWARGFNAALLDGELYPRWLTALNGGAGSPVFFFYAPIPFYVHFLGSLGCPGCSAPVLLGIALWLIVLASSAAFFVFARGYAGTRAAALGALTYALLPYHFAVDAWVRQPIGELAAYIWMPLLLSAVDRIARHGRASVSLAAFYALLATSHLPSTVIFSGFLVLYAVFRARERGSAAVLGWTLLGMGVGALLAGIYLVPALLLQHAISIEELRATHFDYQRWFFFGGPSSAPSFSGQLFTLIGLTTLGFAALFALAYRRTPAGQRESLWVWAAFVGGAWFLMTPLSAPLWHLLPVLQQVQFPWRVAIVVDLAAAAAAALAADRFMARERLDWAMFGVVGVLLAFSLQDAAASARTHWEKSRDARARLGIEASLARGVDAPEYIPSGIDLAAKQDREARIWKRAMAMAELELDDPGGQVSVQRWTSRHLAFAVGLEQPTYATVRQFYFPGWTARASGTGEPLRIEREPGAGLIRLVLPKGQYRLDLVLETLPEERIGAALSSLGLLGTLLLLWWKRRAATGH